jgi:FMN reductase (NADPH)
MNTIINQLYERKSVRVFTDQPVTDDVKRLLFETALQAPTAGNLYLYSMLEISDKNIKVLLAEYCDNQPFIASAPLVVVFLADYDKWYRQFCFHAEDVEVPGLGDLMLASADAVIAAQNMVVAGHSLGMGSCYIGDIIEHCDEVRELLHLPDFTIPVAMLVFGYPTEQQQHRPKPKRPAVEDIVHQNVYQDKKEFYYPPAEVISCFNRKYQTAFRKAMNESMSKYLQKWGKNV